MQKSPPSKTTKIFHCQVKVCKWLQTCFFSRIPCQNNQNLSISTTATTNIISINAISPLHNHHWDENNNNNNNNSNNNNNNNTDTNNIITIRMISPLHNLPHTWPPPCCHWGGNRLQARGEVPAFFCHEINVHWPPGPSQLHRNDQTQSWKLGPWWKLGMWWDS